MKKRSHAALYSNYFPREGMPSLCRVERLAFTQKVYQPEVSKEWSSQLLVRLKTEEKELFSVRVNISDL